MREKMLEDTLVEIISKNPRGFLDKYLILLRAHDRLKEDYRRLFKETRGNSNGLQERPKEQ